MKKPALKKWLRVAIDGSNSNTYEKLVSEFDQVKINYKRTGWTRLTDLVSILSELSEEWDKEIDKYTQDPQN
jgi:hypothetical protein